MFFAGILSALLGIGSGIFKVMAMDGVMKIPMKVSSATSNFMIGVTATASAGAYFIRGDIRPEIAGPVSVGIIIGSWYGARIMPKMPAATIRKIFVVVLSVVSVQMLMKGFNNGWTRVTRIKNFKISKSWCFGRRYFHVTWVDHSFNL